MEKGNTGSFTARKRKKPRASGRKYGMNNKVILVTGGTGSFGQKFTEIVMKEHNPKAMRIYSRGELLQHEMRRKFNDDPRLRFFIGDGRDRERI